MFNKLLTTLPPFNQHCISNIFEESFQSNLGHFVQPNVNLIRSLFTFDNFQLVHNHTNYVQYLNKKRKILTWVEHSVEHRKSVGDSTNWTLPSFAAPL